MGIPPTPLPLTSILYTTKLIAKQILWNNFSPLKQSLNQWSQPIMRIHRGWLIFIEHLLVAMHCLRICSLSSRFVESLEVMEILTSFLTDDCNEDWFKLQSGAGYSHPSLGELREDFSSDVWAGSWRMCRSSSGNKWIRIFQRKKTWNYGAWLRSCI